MFKFSEFVIKNKVWGFFCAFWAFVIIVPLVPFPTPIALIGLPWKAELGISILLFLFLTFYLQQRKGNSLSLPDGNAWWIIAPFSAFILWSGVSALWAESASSVLHHTLVWACYLIFFLTFTNIASDKKLLTLSVFSLGAAIGMIALLCVIEFTFSAVIYEVFGFRYARFAEILAAVFPLFFSFVLRLKRNHLIWASVVTVCVWLAILFSTSRSAFLAAVAGFSVFFAFRLFTKTGIAEKKRLILAASAIALITVFVQFSNFSSGGQSSAISRLTDSGDNSENSVSSNIRLLFWGAAREMIADNPALGVGADNFALKFDDYRAKFSAGEENKEIARQDENAFPERTHNEYLQILTELGITGGIIFLLLIFGIIKLGFTGIKQSFFERPNILNHAAAAGLAAFLLNSIFSSFSFRLMQNGLVFFFLLAILLRKYFVNKPGEKSSAYLFSARQKTVFASIAIFLCLSLAVYSGLKATSQYLVYKAERTDDFETAKFYYENATLLDSANASPNYSLGFRLMKETYYRESAAEFQKAIDKGLYTSITYSHLTTAHILAGQFQEAEKSLAGAAEIYPQSIFVRVRYAFILKEIGKDAESEKQFEIARRLDDKQAETWRSLITEGALRTSENAKDNKQILPLTKLKPEQAVYAVLNERQILHPEEKPQLTLNK